MDTITAIKERRSIRRFKDEKVDRKIINEILEAANYSPTWNHSQIIRYNVIDDKNLINKLANEGFLGFNHNSNIVSGAAGVIVVSNIQGRQDPTEQKSGQAWEMFDAGVASQSLALAAHAMGVGTVVLGIFDVDRVSELVNLPENETIATIIPYGYETVHPRTPPHNSLDEVVRWIR